MRTTKKLTLSAILAALSVVVLLLGSFIEVVDLTAAAIASFLVVFVFLELGTGYAVLVWAVASVLSLLLFPGGASLFYAALGLYPLLKAVYERCAPVWEWLLKMLTCNAILALYVVLAKFVLMLPDEILNGWLLWVFLLLANLAFILYDVALSRLITYYSLRLRPRIARFLK